ncbi:MAG: RecX family transcriptional regulator [Bacteroidetes bacterium]|nr:RecX family transcriptional regulator [Bacteroidota bacterium]
MSPKTNRPIPEWVLSKMKHYCAYQERSIHEVKVRLKTFHLQEEVYDAVINQLINEGFLNEERFAKTFASGKFRINKWGRNKIYQALQQKKVPELFILEGLNEIDDMEYKQTLLELIQKKSETISEPKGFKRNRKLVNFAAGRGFEPRLAWEVVNELDSGE